MNKCNKILICGLGSIGKKHLKLIKKYWPEKSIAILRSSLNKDLEAKENKYKKFSLLKEAIAWEPDAAIISSPASNHIAQSIELARMNPQII